VIIDIEEYRRIARSLQNWPLPASFKNAVGRILLEPAHPATLRSLYARLPASNSNPDNSDAFGQFLQSLDATHHFERIVVLTQMRNTTDKSLSFFGPGIRAIGLTDALTEDFPESNLRLDLFSRTPPGG